VTTHRELHTFFDHSDCVNQVMFTPDGSGIASGSADNSVKVWDTRSHQLIQHYPAHSDAVTSISIHPSGNYLLSSSKDSVLKIWDLREGRLLYSLQGHSGPVNAAAFSADGSFFATGGADQLVMVWKSNLEESVEPRVEWGMPAPPVPAVRSIPKITSTRPLSRLASGVSSTASGSPLKELLLAQSEPHGPASPAAGSSRIPVPQRLAPRTPPKPPTQRQGTAGSPARTETSPEKIAATPSAPALAPAGPAVEQTLGRILGQLDLVTKTLISMENRLTISEDRVTSLMVGGAGAGDSGVFIETGTFDCDED